MSSFSSQSLTLDMKALLLLFLLFFLLSLFLFPLSIVTVLLRNNLLPWLLDSMLLTDRRRTLFKLDVARYGGEKGRSSEPVKCVICLCGIEEGKEIRELRCNHLFHRSCLDRWLEQQFTCPLCRDSLCSTREEEVMALERDEEEVENLLVLLVAHVSNGWWPS